MNNSKLVLLSITFVLASTAFLSAQGITIGSGTAFSLGSASFTLAGSWDNSGIFNAENGSVIFSDPAGNQTVTKTGREPFFNPGETFYNLVVNKAEGNLQLLSNITVNGSARIIRGDIDMNSFTLTLGSNASLEESAGSTVKGKGILTTTRTLKAPSSVNIMGAEITSPAELGNTVITRGHLSQMVAGSRSILRYFEIKPENNVKLNASLILHYDDSEVKEFTEEDLLTFMSEDNGSNWTAVSGSTLNTELNTVSMSRLFSLSRFTLASKSSTSSVELIPPAADSDVPEEYKLMQNSPNPFNPVTEIKFQLPVSSPVSLKIYDIIGNEIAVLLNEEKPAGTHIAYWNGKDNKGQVVTSGIYLYRLAAGAFTMIRKMNLIK